MIFRNLAAALVLASAAGAPAVQAQQADGQVRIDRDWPALSPWVTFLMHLPNGTAICSTATQVPPLGPAGYSVSFVLGDGRTHFYLTLSDGTDVSVDTLQLVGRDGAFADLPVIQHMAQTRSTIADIPKDDFVKKIVPELLKDQEVTLRAGGRTFAVPHANFAAVFDQIRQCADEYRKRYGQPR